MARFLILLIFCLCASPAWAAEVAPEVEFARRGSQIIACVSYDIPEGYHAYAHRPGESGKPTDLSFVLEGHGAMPVLYPDGTPEKDIFDRSITVNTYSGRTVLLVGLPEHSSGTLYAASLEMLLCSNRHCVPFSRNFTGTVPDAIPLLSEVPWQQEASALLRKVAGSPASLSLESGSAPPPVYEKEEKAARTAPPAPVRGNVAGQQPEGEDFDLALTPRYVDTDLEIYSLGGAIFLGILAGLILNAMPCVLPVLTLKISSLLMTAHRENNYRSFRIHNLCFAAGVFTLFTILALVLGLAGMMWGQLYQNQLILLIMLLLVFLMGLSMLGVFTLPVLDLRIGEDTRNPLLKSYLTGLVTTFLATPCSGPLLGGVLAWAFSQPLPELMAVFWSIGAGMSLPYLVFSIWPGLARFMPKPGKWMLVFEQVLGFLLLATSIYLIYVLPEEKRIHILLLLLVAAFCAWIQGSFCGLRAPALARKLCGALGVLLIAATTFWVLGPETPGPVWQHFNPDIFARELGHRYMLVEFTADWCPNCKFLEASVLTEKNLRSWQKRYGLELVRVDITRSNPYAEDLLAQLGSKSIPLTALFGRGQQARSPLVLRDLYGEKTLENALEEVFDK